MSPRDSPVATSSLHPHLHKSKRATLTFHNSVQDQSRDLFRLRSFIIGASPTDSTEKWKLLGGIFAFAITPYSRQL